MTAPLVFAAASALAAVGATAGVSLLGLRAAIDVALAWALLASTIVVAAVLVAGAVAERLSSGVLLGLTLVAASVLWLAARARAPGFGAHLRSGLEGARHALGHLRQDRWVAALAFVTAAELVWRTAVAFVMPPYAGDALWYHLTTVGGWVQNGRVGPSELSIWSTVHPQNGELFFAWSAVLLGRDTLVDTVQLPFAVVAGIAVAGLARSCGLSRPPAAAAGLLFILTPIVLSQTTAAYTDVIVIAFVLAAFHFVLRAIRALQGEGRASLEKSLALAGLAGGLAVGTKELALLYVAVLAALVVAALAAARFSNRATLGPLLRALVLFVLPLLALGAYHYVETWVRFGSPFYPVRASALGVTLFDGRPLEQFLSTPPHEGAWWREIWGQWHADHFFLTRPRFHAYSYDGRPSGLGPLWSYLGLPALLAWAAYLAWRRRLLFLTVLVPVALMFALQPYRWWSRFTMILAALGAIAVVALVQAVGPRLSPLVKAFVAGLVGLGLFFPTLKIDGEFWATRILSIASSGDRSIGAVALPAYRWVDSVPPGSAIGVDTSARQFGGQPFILAYPLFGSAFQHRVYALPSASAEGFRRALAADGITYVTVARGRILDRWATAAMAAGCATRIFDGPVYAGEAGRAYRIRPGCAWSQAPASWRAPLSHLSEATRGEG
ncbi:MAG TPA: phospholipid carrier-dependent glycosyltransferase [Gaiellaceae bacterium]|nr:phospholipid carrier-dependent glycosyltransferase [Gaiellaceae bacterium]